MSILNVDKIQPIGGGSTITVDATDIQASTGTIRASTFSGDVSATGIGVTSLSVAGVTTFTGAVTSSSAITAHDYRSGGGVGNTLYLTSADDWRFRTTGGNERLRLTSTGLLGLNNTNPQTLLSLLGGYQIGWNHATDGTKYAEIYADTSSNLIFRNTNSQTERLRIAAGGNLLASGITTSNTGFMFGTGGQHYLYQSASDTATLRITSDGPYVQFKDVSGDVQMGSASGTLRLSAGGAEKLRVNTQGNFTFYNSAAAWNTIQRATATHYIGIRIQETDGTQRMQFGVAGGANQIVTGAAQHDVCLKSYNANLILATNATERIRITSNGEVIIGNSSVTDGAHFQHYQSAIRHQSFQSTNGDLAIVTDNNSNPAVYVKGTGTADLVNIFDNTTEVFTIKDGGNVGINASNPTAKLHVSGSSTPTILNKPTDASPALFVGDSNRTGAGQHLAEYRGNWNGTNVARMVFHAGDDTTNKDNGEITFRTAAAGSTTERLRIKSDGEMQLTDSTIRYENTGGSFNQVRHLQFPIYFSSSTTHTVLTIGGSLDSGFVCFAVLEYIGLYGYSGQEMSGGVKRAFTRRRNSNTSWREFDDQVSENIGENRRPELFWESGVLKVTTPSSVQITGYITVTAHANDMSNFTLTRN